MDCSKKLTELIFINYLKKLKNIKLNSEDLLVMELKQSSMFELTTENVKYKVCFN